MQVQTWSTAPSAVQSGSRLAVYRATLWVALFTYPLVPGLFYRSHNLSSVSPVLAVIGFLLSYGWAVTGPVMAWFLLSEADRVRLNRAEHPQVVREAILAAIGAPFFVFTGAALVWVHMARFQIAIWYVLLAAVAAARWLPATQAVPSARPVIERVHRISAVILLAFGIAHIANHTAALDNLSAHVTVQNFLRTVYRQTPLEILLVIAALSQVWTGSRLVSRARWQQGTGLRNLQVLAGSFLGMFFISHLSGVFISGRMLGHVDTTFAWATGGPSGLLTNARSPQFVPYYSLAVLAFFLHAACAGRWGLAPTLGKSAALKFCYGVIALGTVVTLLLLLPMSGIRFA
jgi:hypothetical protein